MWCRVKKIYLQVNKRLPHCLAWSTVGSRRGPRLAPFSIFHFAFAFSALKHSISSSTALCISCWRLPIVYICRWAVSLVARLAWLPGCLAVDCEIHRYIYFACWVFIIARFYSHEDFYAIYIFYCLFLLFICFTFTMFASFYFTFFLFFQYFYAVDQVK